MKSLTRSLMLCILALVAVVPALAQRVGINDDQRVQLKQLVTQTRRRSEAERETIRRARLDLMAAYGEYKLDERKARAALDKIGPAQLNLLKIHLDNQIRLRAILSQAQFERFAEMVHGKGRPGMGELSIHEGAFFEGGPDRQILMELGLSPEQIRSAREQLAPNPRAFRRLQRDSQKMGELCADYDLDEQAARKLIDSIHQSQLELAETSHKRQQALRSILTEEQFGRYQGLLAQRIRSRRRFGDRQHHE